MLRAALDEEMDALVSPALDKVRDIMQKRQEEAGSLQDLVSQVQGLADVRRFVDEQLGVDLGSRIRSCHNLVKARARVRHIPARDAPRSAPPNTAPPTVGSQRRGTTATPTQSLALEPFRSARPRSNRR